MTQAYWYLQFCVSQINIVHKQEIDLDSISQIYGPDVVEAIAENPMDFEEKIMWLLNHNFADTVSDICNRFGILLLEPTETFIEKFEQLIARLGEEYADLIGEDLSLLEELL